MKLSLYQHWALCDRKRVVRYDVWKVIGATTPKIGDSLTERDVDALCDNPQNTVTITAKAKR